MLFPRSFFLVSLPLSLIACSTEVGTGDASASGGTGGLSAAGGSGTGGFGLTGGASSTGGATGVGGGSATGGSTSSGGTASGGAPACTPGTGTEDVGTDSLLDKATCLTWQKTKTAGGSISNRAAAKFCLDLVQDGFDDWRLPTTPELRSYPSLAVSGYAYIAGPTMIPNASASDMDGCTTDSHSCNLSQYSTGNFTCNWQGQAPSAYGVFCVRGEAASGSLDGYSAFEMATCCASSSTFKEADCSPYP